MRVRELTDTERALLHDATIRATQARRTIGALYPDWYIARVLNDNKEKTN